jgi:transposase
MERSFPQPTTARLSPDQIRAVYRQGEAAVVALVEALQDRIEHLERLVSEQGATIRRLEGRVEALEARLGQNSRNSHKPPSSDGLSKPPPKSLRTPSGRKAGGQPGHAGRTLQPVAKPNQTVAHRLSRCPCGRCGGCWLEDQPVVDLEKRQVFELPEPALVVTEHQAEIKVCPVSGLRVRAQFPPQVNAPAQYGARFQGLMVYLNQQQFIPSERLTQLCEDLFGQPLSEATLQSATERTAAQLNGFEQALAQLLVRAALVHLDETGMRVEARLHWLHVVSTDKLTFYGVHPKRGTEALDAFEIVPRCRGWAVHDHWAPYFTYGDCLHALCNQHLLRELKFLAEEQQQTWAAELSRYLLHLKQRVQAEGCLGESQFQSVHSRFRALVRRGRELHPPRAGRQSKAANLLDRLESFDLHFLAFLWEPLVPFTNNQAEQDLRMMKVRQKISGGFRTLKGARIFARIRSYLSTCRKHGLNLWSTLQQALLGEPFIPSPLTVPG